jgi:hypothetical protein
VTSRNVPSHASRSTTAAAAGRMTAVMRAATAVNAPRVLRVGVVREGRIVEERVLKKHATVTIGRDEGATFVMDDAPSSVAVIQRDLGAYFLNLRAPIAGRIALEDGVHEIAALRQASRDRDRVRLDESSRGRIAIGNATLLFQFVAVPPDSPTPQLPLAVREGVKLDAGILFVAAFSLLLHFGFVGAMYSDWSDPIVDDGVTVGTLVDLGRHDLLTWTDPAPPAPDPAAKHDDAATDTHSSQATPHPTPSPHPTSTPSHLDAIAREAQVMGMGILTAVHAGSAVEAALARDVPPIDLTDVVKRAGGVTNAGDDLHMTGNTFIAPTNAHGLDHIAGGAVTDGDSHAKIVDVKPPPFTMVIDPAPSTTPMPGAEQEIARLRPQIRRCYERGLAVDPSMAGSMIVRTKVAPNGEVEHATPASVVGLSSEVSACIARVVGGATFGRTANGSMLDVPVKMVQQAR